MQAMFNFESSTSTSTISPVAPAYAEGSVDAAHYQAGYDTARRGYSFAWFDAEGFKGTAVYAPYKAGIDAALAEGTRELARLAGR